MKHIKKLLALALVAITILAVAVPAMAAYSTMYVSVRPGETVRLRNAPNTKATVLVNIPHGTAVSADYYNSNWFRVKYKGYNGFMMSKFLSNSNPGSGSGSTGTPTAGKIVVNSGTVNVRSGPGTNYNSITQLSNGAKITYYAGATQTGSGYTWYRCTGAQWSGYGYIATNYVVQDSGTSGGTLPGVTGNGPNSTVSAQDIRNGNGVWKLDTKTKHPQIAQMQNMLNTAVGKWGNDIGHIAADGVFGEKTRYMVNAFKNSHTVRLRNADIMDQAGLLKLELLTGQTIQ